jgi:hypothetical protein
MLVLSVIYSMTMIALDCFYSFVKVILGKIFGYRVSGIGYRVSGKKGTGNREQGTEFLTFDF